METRNTFGRRKIFTDAEVITEANVRDVLRKAMDVHAVNRSEIQYLYDYYRGKQPVLKRRKKVRPDINNKVVENRANEIVSFKVGYLMGEPIQYVCRGTNDVDTENINLLNEYVFSEDKPAKDKELADWFTICGTSFRMILPDEKNQEDESPFEIYTLDPRDAFVVYHSGVGEKPVMAVKYTAGDDFRYRAAVYTDTDVWEIEDDRIVKHEENFVGGIPIIEYPANASRLGAFEIVISLLDAINEVASNRLDGIQQFVQSFLKFINANVDEESIKMFNEMRAIILHSDTSLPADVEYISHEMNQTHTQTVIDDLYQSVLTICGMPNRNGGSSTSDTGSAVIMRDGWSAAEARAKDTELMFKKSEKQFLKLALNIIKYRRNIDLKLSAIEIRFTRRNYENILEKSQVLTTMLANEKIHPQLAFSHCGMFIDSEAAYLMSKEYYEENRRESPAISSEASDANEAGDAEAETDGSTAA